MFLRRIIPLTLLTAGLWLLAGCFYLPIPEHAESGQRNDVRKAFGAADSDRSLRVGVATRDQVERTLGPPPYATRDGRSVAYFSYARSGAWVYPLCFTATDGTVRVYAVRIDYDDQDRIARWAIDHDEVEQGLLNAWSPLPGNVVKRLGTDARPLEPRDADSVPRRPS